MVRDFDGLLEMGLVVTSLFVMIYIVMTNVVTWFRAMADETRWRIVRLVAERALCVCELADILEMPQSSVSSHVQIIRKAGLLESETCGKWTYFRIRRDHLVLLKMISKHFTDSDAYAADVERCERRMARREGSCCPGPVKLAAAQELIVPNSSASSSIPSPQTIAIP
jgi:DNA-binding transcriptional ArsR family regulator